MGVPKIPLTKNTFYPTKYTLFSKSTTPFSTTVYPFYQSSIDTPQTTNITTSFPINNTYQMPLHVPSESSNETYLNFVFILNVILVPITVILGLLGNLISIFILHKDRYNRVAVFLLQNLALANCFLLSISFFALTISYGILKGVVEDYNYEIKPFLLVYVNPFGSISHCYVIWSTILLALNRYAAICRPFTSKNFLKLSSARIQVVVAAILTLCFNLPEFFEKVIEKYYCVATNNPHPALDPHIRTQKNGGYPNDNLTSESAMKCFKLRNQLHHHDNIIDYKFNYTHSHLGDNQHFQLYYHTIFLTFIVWILPLFLLIFLHVPLIRQLQRSKKLMRHNCLVYDGKNEDNITIAMVVIIFMMAVCHVMDQVCKGQKHMSGKEKSGSFWLYAQNISNYFIILSSSTDFIVYYILKKRFRKEFWRKMYFCVGKEGNSSCGESQGGQEKKISVIKHNFKSDYIAPDCNGGRGEVNKVDGGDGKGKDGLVFGGEDWKKGSGMEDAKEELELVPFK